MKEYRVFGPPGTGKTTMLAGWIGEAARNYGSDGVVVASFTRSAAAELAGRKLPLDKKQVGTLHALCYGLLGCPEIAESHRKEWNRAAPEWTISEGAGDDADIEMNYATEGDAVMAEYGTLRAKMIPAALWPERIRAFAVKWGEWKFQNTYFDFTDMIETVYGSGFSLPYKAGFFDEVQDFTPLELALVRRWAEKMEFVVLAGDDDQCIYHFKGSSPDAFLNPELPAENKRILAQSYRIPRAVQRFSQRWIRQVGRREEKAYAPRDFEGEVRILDTANWKYPEPAVRDAEKYLREGRTVLFATACSYMLEPLKAVLRCAAYPFHNPYRAKRGDWNPLGGRGDMLSAKARILSFLRENWTADDVYRWASGLKGNGRPLFRGAKKFVERLRGADDLYEFLWLEQLMSGDDAANAAARNLEWLVESYTADRQKTLLYPAEIVKKRGKSALEERPRIIVGTIHSVKGGEADVVYLFPDLSAAGIREWISPGERHDGIVRQFYVGATRARESLILCGAAGPASADLWRYLEG